MEPIPKRRSIKRPPNNPQLLQSNLSIQYQHSPQLQSSPLLDTSDFRRSQELIRTIREKEAAFLARRHAPSQQSYLESSQNKQALSYVQSSEIGFHLQDFENRDLNMVKNSSPLRVNPSVIDIQPSQDIEHVKYQDKLIRDIKQLAQKNHQAEHQLAQVVSETGRLNKMHGEISKETEQCQDDIHQLCQMKPDNGLHQQIAITRNQNTIIKAHIQQAEFHRGDLFRSLKLLQTKREHGLDDVEDRKKDVYHKLAVIKELEAKRAFAADQLDRVELQVEQYQVKVAGTERIIFEDSVVIDKLTKERDEIMEKLVHLNRVYQHSVQECGLERTQVIEHARYQRSILSSQVMFNTLEGILKQRQQSAFSDFVFYCGFDKNVHSVLVRFSKILEDIGYKRVQASLTKWFQTVFDPITARDRLQLLAEQFHSCKLKARAVSAWFTSTNIAQDQGTRYKQGFIRISQVSTRFTRIDVGQRFNKWRSECKLMTKQDHIMRRIIQRQFDGRRRQVLTRLLNHSWQTEAVSRRQTLCVSAAYKQFQLSLMLKLRQACVQQKQNRVRKQRMIFKAWKDGIAYFKYMAQQKKQAARLNKLSKVRLLAQLFWELRLSKENEKYLMMQEKLSENVHPTITRLQNLIRAKATKMVAMRKVRAFKSLQKFALYNIAAYFQFWKRQLTNSTVKGSVMLKRILTRNFRADIHSAMLNWRANARWLVLHGQGQTVEQLQVRQNKLVAQLTKLNYKLEIETYRQITHKQRALKTAVCIFNKRAQEWGIRKWRRLSRNWRVKKGQCISLFEKHSRQIKRHAFRRYCQNVAIKVQNDKDYQRQMYYKRLRGSRLKKRVFVAMKLYLFRFVRSRRYWSILQRTMDYWIKKRTIVRWQDQAHADRIEEVRLLQNFASNKFDSTNVTLGQKAKDLGDQKELNLHLQKKLKIQGQRSLSNCFARYYYIKAERGLNQWREAVQFWKHREHFLKTVIQKQNKSNFHRFKACIQNSISQQNILQVKQQINHTVQLSDQQADFNAEVRKAHQKLKHELEQQIDTTSQDFKRIQMKWSQIIELIARKQLSHYYSSKRRFLFQRWVMQVRRQNKFIAQMTKIIQKSLTQKGFTNIQIRAIGIESNATRQSVALGMVRRYWQKKCAPAFSKLRRSQYQVNTQVYSSLVAETSAVLKAHSLFRAEVSAANNERSGRLVIRSRLSDVFKAWKVVIKCTKGLKAHHIKLQQHMFNQNCKRSLLLWKQRSAVTVKIRSQIKKFKAMEARNLKRIVLASFKRIHEMVRRTNSIIQHLGQKVRHCRLQTAFHKIGHHTDAIELETIEVQKKSIRELCQSLNFIYKTRFSTHFRHLSGQIVTWSNKQHDLKALIGHLFIKRLRVAFRKWRAAAHYMQTADDVEECGPVVEEVLQQRLVCRNLQAFMRDQKYTKAEVEDVADLCQSKSVTRLKRAVARLKCRNIKPMAFERWKQFVHLRKLMRYILRNLQNRLQPVKADLNFAFNKWRTLFTTRKRQLIGTDINKLVQLATKLNADLSTLDETGYNKTNLILEASANRDELFAGAVSGQKLACALGRDNIKRSGHRAVAALAEYSHNQRKQILEAKLRQQIEQISKLRQQARATETQNGVIAADNEQLRQSSLDGFIVGKGAQQLGRDRERLSMDLADKTKAIKSLLQANQTMNAQLEEALRKIEHLKSQI